MEKREFIDKLIYSAALCRRLALAQEYVNEELVDEYVFSLNCSQVPLGETISDDEVKILGGRILKRSALKCISAMDAGKYLWVDGKVPSWINVCAVGFSKDFTEIEVTYTNNLVEANLENMWPDVGMEKNNPLVPFRIRGPSLEDWQNAKRASLGEK